MNEPKLARDPDGGDAATDAAGKADAAGDATTDAPPLDADADAVDADADAAGEAGLCDPVTGGGCGSGQKCGWIIDQLTPVVTGHTGCKPLLGNKTLHADCNSSADDCAAGYHCSAECDKVCRSAADCPQGHGCAPTNAFADRAGVGRCLELCDPVRQDCAEPDQACYWFGNVGGCFDRGTRSGECNSLGGLECERGSECVPISDTVLQCRPFCDPAAASFCPTPQTCKTFAELFGDPRYAQTFGVCMPP